MALPACLLLKSPLPGMIKIHNDYQKLYLSSFEFTVGSEGKGEIGLYTAFHNYDTQFQELHQKQSDSVRDKYFINTFAHIGKSKRSEAWRFV